MAFKKVSTESKGFDRELIPEGVYTAVVAHMIDWGTQTETYEGKEKKRRTVRIGFLFPTVIQEFEIDGDKVSRPAMISRWYTLSLDPKSNLHKDLSAILGRSLKEEEDIDALIETNLMASVVHDTKKDGTKFDKIGSMMPLPSTSLPETGYPAESIKVFDLDEPNREVFDSLGEREQEIIKAAPEYVPF